MNGVSLPTLNLSASNLSEKQLRVLQIFFLIVSGVWEGSCWSIGTRSPSSKLSRPLQNPGNRSKTRVYAINTLILIKKTKFNVFAHCFIYSAENRQYIILYKFLYNNILYKIFANLSAIVFVKSNQSGCLADYVQNVKRRFHCVHFEFSKLRIFVLATAMCTNENVCVFFGDDSAGRIVKVTAYGGEERL